MKSYMWVPFSARRDPLPSVTFRIHCSAPHIKSYLFAVPFLINTDLSTTSRFPMVAPEQFSLLFTNGVLQLST